MKLIVLVAFAIAAVVCPSAEAWNGGWNGGGGGWHHGGGGWGGGGWNRGWGGGGGWNRGWGGHRHWRDTAALKKEDESAPTCDWVEADAMLICKSRTALFHCAVVANFTEATLLPSKYDWFGIGMLPAVDYSAIEPLLYEYALYPRVADAKWLDTKFLTTKNAFSSLSLFHSLSIPRFGLRVVDDACFRSLTTMFSAASTENTWRITVDKTEFALFGEIRRV